MSQDAKEIDPWEPETLEQAIKVAKRMVRYGIENGIPTAFEVVKTKTKPFEIQPFGMHALFKSHKLLHVEPIPKDKVAA